LPRELAADVTQMKRVVLSLSLVLTFLLSSAVYSQSNKPLKPVE
jgi:hypothetical protein